MRSIFSKKNASGGNRKHLNRRGRRNADGAASDANAKSVPSVFETLEGRTMMSVSTDAQGWSVVNPAGDSKVIYVSNSAGNDSNTGLSASSPVKSLSKGEALLRNGSADQLLLKRGDTWNETFGNWDKSGRSDDEPLLVGAYGSGALPTLKTGGRNALQTGGTPVSHVFIQGIHFDSAGRTASNGAYGMQFLSKLDDLTLEGCEIEGFRMNLSFQSYFGPITDVTLHRNSIHHSWSTPTAGHSSGLFVQGVNGIQLIENVFNHNGWSETESGSQATIFNHGTYMRADNENVVVIGNIFANASSHGLQARSGGIIKNNLFLNNPIQLSFGLVNGSPVKPGGVTGEVSGNVMLGGRDISGSPRGWGIEVGNIRNGAGASIHDNILAQDVGNTSAAFMLEYGSNLDNPGESTGAHDVTIENNVVYKWNTGLSFMNGMAAGTSGLKAYSNLTVRNNEFAQMNSNRFISHGPSFSSSQEHWSGNNYFDDNGGSFSVSGNTYSLAQWKSQVESTAKNSNPQFKDPTRNAASYMAAIGGTASTSAFLNAAEGLSYGNYKAQYAASAVIAHVKAGFNRSAEPTPTPTPTPEPTPTPTPSPIEDSIPTATLAASTLTTEGQWHEFKVEYKDDSGIDIATVNSSDIRVKGTNGFDLPVTMKSVAKTATGAIATYLVTTPGQNWDPNDNGTYTVIVMAQQVLDGRGTAVKGGALGTFNVSIGATPAPTPTPEPTPVPPPQQNAGAPRVVSTRFVREGGLQKLKFTFNQDVSASLSLKDIAVFNTSTGGQVAGYTMSLSYDKASNVATLTFKVALRAGEWKANIWSGGVHNATYTSTLDGDGNGVSGGNYAFKFTV